MLYGCRIHCTLEQLCGLACEVNQGKFMIWWATPAFCPQSTVLSPSGSFFHSLNPYTAKPSATANCKPAVSAACTSGVSSSACSNQMQKPVCACLHMAARQQGIQQDGSQGRVYRPCRLKLWLARLQCKRRSCVHVHSSNLALTACNIALLALNHYLSQLALMPSRA